MSISARLLYEDWADSIGGTYGEDRLARIFVRATNMATDDLGLDADLETRITHITSIDGSIGVADTFGHSMYAGISVYATTLGMRPADPKIATVVFNFNRSQWERFKGQYARSIDNANQPEQSDTMENLGYLDD